MRGKGLYIRQTCASLDPGEESRDEESIEGVMGEATELEEGNCCQHRTENG